MEAVAAAEAETEGSVVIPRARQDLPRLIKFLGHAVLTFFCFPQDTGTDRQTDSANSAGKGRSRRNK